MSCNHQWSEECYAVVPSQVCVRCNAFRVEEEEAELIRDAYRRGAEAMRETAMNYARKIGFYALAADIRCLPSPGEP